MSIMILDSPMMVMPEFPKKLDAKIVSLLMPRLNDEYKAFYFYRAASNYCKGVGYEKAAEFFAAESLDELSHAKGIETYLVDWNIDVNLPIVETPQIVFSGLFEVLVKAYELEYNLWKEYNDTSDEIFGKGDIATFNFLRTYTDIQTKSVAEYSDKLNMLEGVNVMSKFELLTLEKKLF